MKKLKTIENDLTYLRQISKNIDLSKDNYKELLKSPIICHKWYTTRYTKKNNLYKNSRRKSLYKKPK